ncbi:MAG: hypothetical protein IBX62_08220 [Coriobacteriia bacterium]|nr:hypothetical protein [Coriobacteriia bacterium]
MGSHWKRLTLGVAAVALLAALAVAAGCDGDGPGYERGGDELWHEVGYETTKVV